MCAIALVLFSSKMSAYWLGDLLKLLRTGCNLISFSTFKSATAVENCVRYDSELAYTRENFPIAFLAKIATVRMRVGAAIVGFAAVWMNTCPTTLLFTACCTALRKAELCRALITA